MPVSCLSFWQNNIYFLYLSIRPGNRRNDILDKSVLAFILGKKSANFLRIKDKQYTHHLFWFVAVYSATP